MLETRTTEVISPLPGLKFERMLGVETLGRPFELEVDVLSANGDLSLSETLGKPMTVAMWMGAAPPRCWSGVIARLAQVGIDGEHFRYRAHLRPWLWLLSKNQNSRIFQSKDHGTLIDVLAAVWSAYGQEFDATGVHEDDYPCPEYLVQYQESDFDFVSRLMERAGIYYYFRHEPPVDDQPGRHILALAAGLATERVNERETVRYIPPDSGRTLDRSHEHLDSWSVGYQVEPGVFVAKEFDFHNPRAPLVSASREHKGHPFDDLEVFEYPGGYIADGDRQSYVVRRRQELQLRGETCRGGGTARGIAPGLVFGLTGYPADQQNKAYLVTSVSYSLASNAFSSGSGGRVEDFRCSFDAVDARTIYRTPVTTRKPVVGGPQTAIVVGPKGEEIWTDKHGRAKVKFHWDREGAGDENSSCWVRVSQVWAGAKWGGVHIPRVGQEVVVDFLEGDPDRPIITGRVFNADNPVPYALPANQTQSGMKSRSTPGGHPNTFNEIRFEDRKGREELHFQAERDLTTHVKRNRSATVGGADVVTVGGDHDVTVTGNMTVRVLGGSADAPQSSLEVNGDHWLTATRSIDITAPTSISLACGDSFILMEPEKITLGVGDAGRVVIDASVFARSEGDRSSITIDRNGEARMQASTNAVVSGKAVAATAELTADVTGDKVTVGGKTEAVVKGGANAWVRTHGPGVDLSGTLIKMNS